MSDGVTVEVPVHFVRGSSGERLMREGTPPSKPVVPEGRVPRISRLMALALRFEDLVRRGEVEDYAQIAELGHVTRARMAQIMNLLNLAPDIQEELLFHPPVRGEREAVSERDLRRVCALPDWQAQRGVWTKLVVRN